MHIYCRLSNERYFTVIFVFFWGTHISTSIVCNFMEFNKRSIYYKKISWRYFGACITRCEERGRLLPYNVFELPLGNGNIVSGRNFQCPVFPLFICFESPESKKWFLKIGLCVCMCVCVCVCVCVWLCVCYQHSSKKNYSKNIKFSILLLYYIQMLLETFHKDRTKTLYTGAHKWILIH